MFFFFGLDNSQEINSPHGFHMGKIHGFIGFNGYNHWFLAWFHWSMSTPSGFNLGKQRLMLPVQISDRDPPAGSSSLGPAVQIAGVAVVLAMVR